jgi:hypothetical protein
VAIGIGAFCCSRNDVDTFALGSDIAERASVAISAEGQTVTRRKVMHMSAVHLNTENYIVKADIIIAK